MVAVQAAVPSAGSLKGTSLLDYLMWKYKKSLVQVKAIGALLPCKAIGALLP